MVKKDAQIMSPDEVIMNKIYQIRGKKVMLDRDLTNLYDVETKVLKQSVRCNIKRFSSDFMYKCPDRKDLHQDEGNVGFTQRDIAQTGEDRTLVNRE